MNEKDTFLEFAESLKLVRKTRIEDYISDKTIDDIYTDLLPNDGIINKLNLPRTTILVGRKGTGKSTIFQKSQKDLIANKKCISIYIDVKSLFDNSIPEIPEAAQNLGKEFNKYLLYSNLIKEIVLETKRRLKDFVDVSILKKILGFDYEQIRLINEELLKIENSITDVIKNVDLSLMTAFKKTDETNDSENNGIDFKIKNNPSLSLASQKESKKLSRIEFESTLVNYLDIKKSLISNLTRIKEILQIDHLYIFLDDFSEIEENAQKIFMDWFVVPLNNLSDDFVKFKIATYPNRFYYGKLDNSKIDEISLEFFDAFYSFEKEVNITKMESLALDYTKRLILKRLNLFFPNNHWEKYFSIPENELFDILFSVSFNNPRKIGFIMSFCYESSLIHERKISREAIENASQRYFIDVTLKYFLANQFVTKPFSDKISNEHQFELLNKIIDRQKNNAKSASKIKVKGKPLNNFTVNNQISNLLDNLELNGLLTTYNKVMDSNGQLSTIYTFDYGLCRRYGLNFSRPYNPKLIRYVTAARFNMNVLIADYFKQTQLIRCSKGHEYSYDLLEKLKLFNMRCPDCLDSGVTSFCEITVSSDAIRNQLKNIEDQKIEKFSAYEFQVLDYLHIVGAPVSIVTIARAIDKSEDVLKPSIEKLISRNHVSLDLVASRTLKKDFYVTTETGNKYMLKINQLIKEILDNHVNEEEQQS